MSSILFTHFESSPNITSSQSICDKRLLELGQLSREGYNASITNNICPDSIFTPIFSSVILVIYVILVIVGVLGVYWKRNSGHVKARHSTFMVLTMVASFMFVLLTCLRYIVGRKIFPCFLYSISIFITPAAICLPTVLRFVRIFFMYRLNLKKAANVRASKEFYMQNNSELTKKVEEETEKPSTQNIELDLTSNEQSNKENIELNHEISDQELNNSNTTSVEKSDIDSNSDGLDQAYLDYSESTMFSKSFKILNFILSNKFIVLVYVLSFGFHLVVWGVFGGVDEILWSTSKKRLFLWNVSMFQFDSGCVTTTNGVILMASEAAFYIFLEFSFFISLFFVDRDTWSIKIEAIIVIIVQIILVASFLISGQIEVIRFFTDYIVPYGFSALLYPILEIIISVILPVVYAIKQDRKPATDGNEMEILLNNRETFWLILDYSRRSYCPEDILAYKDIENFKQISKKNRKQVALKIINTYLVHDSPLELNIPNASTRYQEIYTFLTGLADDDIVPTDLFDDIKLACLTNMTDIFERLKSSNLEFKQKFESLKRKDEGIPFCFKIT